MSGSISITLSSDAQYRAKLRELRRRLALLNDDAQLLSARDLGSALARLSADCLALASGTAPALPEQSEFTSPMFPRSCRACERVFETRSNFECLQLLGYVGAFKTSSGLRCATELRRCVCSNTIALDVELPMSRTAPSKVG